MDRLPPDLAAVIAELRDGLETLYGARFRDLLLYGSYARGEQREGSDVDLLLLLDGPVDTGRKSCASSRSLGRFPWTMASSSR